MRIRIRWWLNGLAGEQPSRRELMLLAGAIVLGLAVRIAYLLATHHIKIAGDELEYDSEGVFIAHGRLFWTRQPYGIAHAGAWKAPGYPAWVGFWYWLLGHHPFAVRVAQLPFGAITIACTWVLGRRLFGVRVGVAAAFVVACYPLAFQYEELLYPESIATPLTLIVLIVVLTYTPTVRRSLLTGALMGIALLVRPSEIFLMLGVLVVWVVVTGWRRGVLLSVLAAVTAALVVSPWTIRNAIVMHGFIPVSLEDAAAYGTFNAQAANDPDFPYAWRQEPPNVEQDFNPAHPLSDVELDSRLVHAALSYIEAHPVSLAEAFYWNGITRLWDIRSRSKSLVEVPYEGRSKLVTELGLDIYDVLLPLALIALWRARRRRSLVLGLLAVALGASIVFTADAGTRYRAPLEPVIAMLACACVLGVREPLILNRVRRRRGGGPPATARTQPELSAVIPTLGNHDLLSRVLDGFALQDGPPDRFEVIVAADQAEPDLDALRARIGERGYPITVVQAAAPGASAARNAGYRAAAAPLVLFTDNDTIPTRTLVSEHLSWHQRAPERQVVVVGLVRWAPGVRVTPFMRWLEHGVQFDYHSIAADEAQWSHIYSSNCSIKRTFLDTVGGFDEQRLPYGYEDLDWGYRAHEHGLIAKLNRHAVVDHWREMTVEDWRRRAPRLAYSEWRFCELHPDVEPWFKRIFSEAAALPPGGGRSAALTWCVPRRTPLLGREVWSRATLYWRQQIAPQFLEAWANASAGVGSAPAPAVSAASERESMEPRS